MKLHGKILDTYDSHVLLDGLLSGLKPDGVRLILGKCIKEQIEDCEKSGAGFLPSQYSANGHYIRVFMVNHGEITAAQHHRLYKLVNLYNNLEEWGTE